MVSSEGELVGTPGQCKEYTLDHVNNAITGFKNSYINFPDNVPCLTETRVFVVGKNESQVVTTLDLIHKAEDLLKIPHTVVNSSETSFVFRASPIWMISPPMLSFYTFLIRQGRKHSIENNLETSLKPQSQSYWANDAILVCGGLVGIKNILKHGIKKLFGENIKANWPDNNKNIHQWGISAYGYGTLKKEMPQWYEDSMA
jgi:hypothetical protein